MSMQTRWLALVLGALLAALPAIVGGRPEVSEAAVPAGYVRAIEGSGAEVVAGTTHAYVTNSAKNHVEVLSLTTGVLETPIPVGAVPLALDLSPDGSTLYVANQDSNDVSVVDLALRREVGRIALPAEVNRMQPRSIAVAANGTALLAGAGPGPSSGGLPLLQLDLATGTVRERPEARPYSIPSDQARVRASRDRSRIVVTDNKGETLAVTMYTAASDAFGPRRFVGRGSPVLAVDGAGSRMLVGDELVLDGDLRVRATLPKANWPALAVNGPGSTGYRTRDGDGKVEVLDLARGLVTGSIAVPGGPYLGPVALTPNDASLVVLTATGIAVVPTSAAVPTPACPSAPAPPLVVRVCGAPLADVVLDGRGQAYLANRERNQVEVVNLANRSLGTPIPVGSQPRELDLSPDGNTLYVANAGGEDVSVVDLVARREVRRITVPSSTNTFDRSFSIAVAGNGKGLLTTSYPGSDDKKRFFEFDLGTGAIRERTDAPPGHLEASGDRSKVVTVPGDVRVYDAATDSFGPPKSVSANVYMVAVDRTASKLLLGPGAYDYDPGTYVLDGALVRRATISPTSFGLAVNPAGTTGYQLQPQAVQVVDLARALPVKQVKLPETVPSPSRLAVTNDERTLVVLTPSGVAVLDVAAATPAAPCAGLPRPPSGVIGTCGALDQVVIDGAGRAYASNPSRNQIEVVNVATGALEASIPVGSRPRGLDLGPDGRTLYVANSGAEELSVVDLVQRREVRRITAASVASEERPYSIAVGSEGVALFTTTSIGAGYVGRMHQLDLATGVVRLRSDYGPRPGVTGDETLLEASGDHSRIAVFEAISSGEARVYDAAADSFGPARLLGDYSSAAALDAHGDRVLTGNPGTFLVGSDLGELAKFPRGGRGVTITSDGKTGYRVHDGGYPPSAPGRVEVLDMDRGTAVRSTPLPDAVTGTGAVALSPDGTTLAVVTHNGLALVPATAATMEAPYSVWAQPQDTPLDGTGSWIGVVHDPAAGPRQRPPTYAYAHYFGFAGSSALGFVGLVTQPGGKYAVFAVAGPDGQPYTAAVPYDWKAGRFYFPFVHQLGPGSWGAWVYDATAGRWTTVGTLALPASWGKLGPSTVTAASWFGPVAPACSAYPWADVVFAPPTGIVGTVATTATLTASGRNPGDCPAQSTIESQVWTRYRLGTSAAG